MASLASVNVLSLNTDETEKRKNRCGNSKRKDYYRYEFHGLKPTTIPDGVYTVPV